MTWVIRVKKPKPNGKIVKGESGIWWDGKRHTPGNYELPLNKEVEFRVAVRNEGDEGRIRTQILFSYDRRNWKVVDQWVEKFSARQKKTYTCRRRLNVAKTWYFKFVVKREDDGAKTDEWGCETSEASEITAGIYS